MGYTVTLRISTYTSEVLMSQDKPKSSSNREVPARVTSHDVAKAAGVSQSVVSRAFNPKGRIAASTREKVLAVAKELGYYPNALARTLVQQRTQIVGVLMARIDNHFYPKVLEDLTAQLWAAGRQVMYFNIDEGQDLGDMLRTALQYRVEAMVVASITLSSSMVEAFSDVGIPVILFNRSLEQRSVHIVSCDNALGGRKVAELFLDAQHTNYAFIGGSPDTSTNQERKRGFMAGLQERGGTLLYALEKEYSYAWGRSAAHYLFSQDTPPDAIFCASDLIALGALDTARGEFALRVPEDVALVGFDDIQAAGWLGYGLTTVRQPVEEMVAQTLDIIVGEGAQSVQVTLPVTLVTRGTTRPSVAATSGKLEEASV